MSWLTDRLERPGLRPFPVGPLAARLGIVEADPEFTARLSERLGLDRGWVLRCRKLGLTLAQADEWATNAGVHPAEIWAGYSRGLVGAALANANRTHCRCGRRYDRVDSNGSRRCSRCWAEAKRRHRISLNVQVVALFPERAPHVALGGEVQQNPKTPGRERVWALVPPEVAERIGVLASEANLSRSAWVTRVLEAAVRAGPSRKPWRRDSVGRELAGLGRPGADGLPLP